MKLLKRWPWPLPAFLSWAICWLAHALLLRLGLGLPSVLLGCTALGALLGLGFASGWRRLFIGLGYPLSLLFMGTVALPAWSWLLALLVLVLLYPFKSWRDAPLFPTPAQALAELATAAPLSPGAKVLDAGCGLGHGLKALRLAYPQASLHGLEWSRPLAWLCARRCPWAQISRGDIWQADWSAYQLVYLYQRPESMPRAAQKAQAQLQAGAYLVSLEFAAPDLKPIANLQTLAGKPVWVYRIPAQPPTT